MSLAAGVALSAEPDVKLTAEHHKELIVFSMRAMGTRVTPADVKGSLSRGEVVELVAAGLNLNGHLCAELIGLRALELESKYEATCIVYRGGSAQKSYIIDAPQGVAFEQ
jgi:hypothetical protein